MASNAQPRHIELRVALSAADLDGARLLFIDYADSIKVDLCFQGFEAELQALPGEYAGPRGTLLVATVDGDYAGCCAFRPQDSTDYANACELKRLYVRPQFRGLGLGRRLAETILELAQQSNYDCVLLDTLDDMESARALYEDLGFEPIPPYYFNPIAGAHYLKVDL